MPVTEFFFAPLKPGSDISDPSKPEGQIGAEVNSTLLARPGMQRLYWGMQVENPGTATFMFDWDKIEDHQAFQADASYGPFMQKVGSILGGTPTMFHVPLDPFPAFEARGKTRAPATEVLTVYFPGDYSTAEQDDFRKGLEGLLQAASSAEGFTGVTGGFSVENNVQYEGNDTKVFQALIGWTSVDAHLKFRETPAFKDNIAGLRSAPKVIGMSVAHVPFEEVDSSVEQ